MEFQEYAAREVSALVNRLASGVDERTEARIQDMKRDYEAAVASLHRQLDMKAQELEVSIVARDRLASANAAAAADIANAQAALEAAKDEAERLRQQFDTSLEALRAEHLSTLQEQALARTELPLDELIAVFAALVDATAPSALLTLVVSGLAREFSRVALFRVRNGSLECVKHVGFDFDGDIANVAIPLSIDSLMTRAVTTRTMQSFLAQTGADTCDAPFGGTPACALALPFISGDATVAVIYADDSDKLEFASVPPSLLVKFGELLWWHAVLLFQRASETQRTLSLTPPHGLVRPRVTLNLP